MTAKPENKISEAKDVIERAQKTVAIFKKARVNGPCPCRSGKKYKKCCIYKVQGMKAFLKKPEVQQFIKQTDAKA